MSDESPYSKREQDVYFKNIDDNFQRLFKKLDSQDITLNLIAGNQNDNQIDIAVIKDTIKDYPELKEVVSSLVNYKWWLIGTVAAFTVLGGTTLLLIKNQLKSNISMEIDSKVPTGINDYFNNHFSNIKIINN